MFRYLRERDLPHRMLGKLVVAASGGERPVLARLQAQARANGVAGVRALSAADVRALEPAVCGAAAGLLSPDTGIVRPHPTPRVWRHIVNTCA